MKGILIPFGDKKYLELRSECSVSLGHFFQVRDSITSLCTNVECVYTYKQSLYIFVFLLFVYTNMYLSLYLKWILYSIDRCLKTFNKQNLSKELKN